MSKNKATEDKVKLEVGYYALNVATFWENFPLMLNVKSETHIFLDFYQRVDDLMGEMCFILYKKRFNSFKVRKDKIEQILGKFIPEVTQKLLDCRRQLTHEIVKTHQDESLFTKSIIYTLNLKIPTGFRKFKTSETEAICWYALYVFNLELGVKYMNEVRKRIQSLLNVPKTPSLEKITEFMVYIANDMSKLIYLVRDFHLYSWDMPNKEELDNKIRKFIGDKIQFIKKSEIQY